jgi:hypothetical protein
VRPLRGSPILSSGFTSALIDGIIGHASPNQPPAENHLRRTPLPRRARAPGVLSGLSVLRPRSSAVAVGRMTCIFVAFPVLIFVFVNRKNLQLKREIELVGDAALSKLEIFSMINQWRISYASSFTRHYCRTSADGRRPLLPPHSPKKPPARDVKLQQHAKLIAVRHPQSGKIVQKLCAREAAIKPACR